MEVRDFLIEDEPIEEIIKRIYAGESLARRFAFERSGRSARPLRGILARGVRQYSRVPAALFHRHRHLHFERDHLLFHLERRISHPGQSIAGYNLPQMITYVSVGWIIRSFYTNTIDQEMAYEVIEGKIAMDLIKPVSVQWMWISRAIGESAFRLGLLTLPTAIVMALFSRPGSRFAREFPLFLPPFSEAFF